MATAIAGLGVHASAFHQAEAGKVVRGKVVPLGQGHNFLLHFRQLRQGHKTFVGMIKEWADVCLFATRDLFKSKVNGVDKTLDGGRVVKTNWSPAFDAKNRLMLKELLELSWVAFEADLASAKLRRTFASLLAKTTKLSPEERATWEKVNPLALTDEKLQAGINKLK